MKHTIKEMVSALLGAPLFSNTSPNEKAYALRELAQEYEALNQELPNDIAIEAEAANATRL